MKLLETWLIVLSVMLFSVLSVSAVTFEVEQLTFNDFDDYDVVMDEEYIIWTGYDGNDLEIYLYDGSTVSALTDNGINDHSPHLEDGKAVWITGEGSAAEVVFWDGTNATELTDDGIEQFSPRTNMGEAVWVGREGEDDTEIYYWNGSTINQLTDDSAVNEEPDIEDGWAAWSRWNDGEQRVDLYLWNGTTTQKITTDEMMGRRPRFDGHNLVWHGFPQGTYADEVYYWDGTTIANISDKIWTDWNPEVSNGKIVWMGADNAGWQIYMWADGEKTKLTNFYNPSVDPDIDGGEIVWSSQGENYDFEIKYYDGVYTVNVSNKPGWDEKPKIKNGRIAWHGFDGNDKEIYVARRVANMMNCWHIPSNIEPPSVTMRNPLSPDDNAENIYFYVGAYPMGTIYSGTLYYREAGTAMWNESSFNWDVNQYPNEYWMASFANNYDAGDAVEYYLKLQNPAYNITYVYGSDSQSFNSTEQSEAQENPFEFTIQESGVPSPTPTPTSAPNLMNVWHIPTNEEPPTVHMRNPLYPSATDENIYVYLGGWPQGTIHYATLYYRKNNMPQWNTAEFAWDSNPGDNEYFIASFENFLNPGDTLKYFISAENPGYDTTYVYGTDDTSQTTADLDHAASNPYTYTLPSSTPTPTPTEPTATPESNPLPNVWHIPANEEPPSVTMRNPLNVGEGDSPVYIYTGAYPAGTLYSGKLYYRKQGNPIWSSSDLHWDSNNSSNEYWMASFANPYQSGDQIQYYLELWNPGYDTTFLHDGNAKTTARSTAEADPYTFTVGAPIPAFSAVGLVILIAGMGVAIYRKH